MRFQITIKQQAQAANGKAKYPLYKPRGQKNYDTQNGLETLQQLIDNSSIKIFCNQCLKQITTQTIVVAYQDAEINTEIHQTNKQKQLKNVTAIVPNLNENTKQSKLQTNKQQMIQNQDLFEQKQSESNQDLNERMKSQHLKQIQKIKMQEQKLSQAPKQAQKFKQTHQPTILYCVGCFASLQEFPVSYSLRKSLKVAPMDSKWRIIDQICLLNGVKFWGFSNWGQIKQFMDYNGCPFTVKQIESHYQQVYLLGDGPFVQNLIKISKNKNDNELIEQCNGFYKPQKRLVSQIMHNYYYPVIKSEKKLNVNSSNSRQTLERNLKRIRPIEFQEEEKVDLLARTTSQKQFGVKDNHNLRQSHNLREGHKQSGVKHPLSSKSVLPLNGGNISSHTSLMNVLEKQQVMDVNKNNQSKGSNKDLQKQDHLMKPQQDEQQQQQSSLEDDNNNERDSQQQQQKQQQKQQQQQQQKQQQKQQQEQQQQKQEQQQNQQSLEDQEDQQQQQQDEKLNQISLKPKSSLVLMEAGNKIVSNYNHINKSGKFISQPVLDNANRIDPPKQSTLTSRQKLLSTNQNNNNPPIIRSQPHSNNNQHQQQPQTTAHPKYSNLKGHNVYSYNPKRKQFEIIEYDYYAETMIAQLQFLDDDTQQQQLLKIKIIEEYNRRLDERIKRRQFVIEHRLLDTDFMIKTLQKYNKNNVQKFEPFRRLIDNNEQYLQIVQTYDNLCKTKALTQGLIKVKNKLKRTIKNPQFSNVLQYLNMKKEKKQLLGQRGKHDKERERRVLVRESSNNNGSGNINNINNGNSNSKGSKRMVTSMFQNGNSTYQNVNNNNNNISNNPNVNTSPSNNQSSSPTSGNRRMTSRSQERQRLRSHHHPLASSVTTINKQKQKQTQNNTNVQNINTTTAITNRVNTNYYDSNINLNSKEIKINSQLLLTNSSIHSILSEDSIINIEKIMCSNDNIYSKQYKQKQQSTINSNNKSNIINTKQLVLKNYIARPLSYYLRSNL